MCNSKSQNISKSASRLPQIPFYGDYLKTEWDLEQVTCQAIFYVEF